MAIFELLSGNPVGTQYFSPKLFLCWDFLIFNFICLAHTYIQDM